LDTVPYWDSAGAKLTGQTLEAAFTRAKEAGIGYLVVTSTTGRTARAALEMLPSGLNLVVVTHHQGYKEPGVNECDPETIRLLQEKGAGVLTTTHLLANVERAVTNKWGGLYPGGIVSATLRMFGQGTKVCVEASVMALDAGLVPYGEDIMACGGTGRGLDTAIILRPAHSNHFFDTVIREVVAKPRCDHA
jgi:hypothetical protein